MAAIRKVKKRSRVRWRVSWYDALGQRHQKFFSTRTEAAQQQADATKSTRHRLTLRVDPNVTVCAYAKAWLPQHASEQDLKPRTVESYDATLRLTSSPWMSGRRRSAISRSRRSAGRS